MNFVIGVAVGILCGLVLALVVLALVIDAWHVGTLNLDASIPDEPYYFMEVDRGMAHKLSRNRRVLLTVRKSNYVDKT